MPGSAHPAHHASSRGKNPLSRHIATPTPAGNRFQRAFDQRRRYSAVAREGKQQRFMAADIFQHPGEKAGLLGSGADITGFYSGEREKTVELLRIACQEAERLNGKLFGTCFSISISRAIFLVSLLLHALCPLWRQAMRVRIVHTPEPAGQVCYLFRRESAQTCNPVENTMRMRFSLSSVSVLVALALAVWEYYFFWHTGQTAGRADGSPGFFTPDRLGFNLAWLATLYLTFQLISIPFTLPAVSQRFVGVLDGMASLVPLAVVLVVIFGKPELLGTSERWEAAFLLAFVSATDLFGGYAFNIALSRRIFDVGASPAA